MKNKDYIDRLLGYLDSDIPHFAYCSILAKVYWAL